MKVYVVLKNADFNTGCGPMFLDKVFATKELAQKYIKNQTGIQGSPQLRHALYHKSEDEDWNGYEIKTMKVLDIFDTEQLYKQKQKIEELKKELEILESEYKNILNFNT